MIHELPLPRSGVVSHVIHISDLHIRSGDLKKSRYIEYSDVFERFIKFVSTIPAVKNESAVLMITGDIFHHKLRIESAGIQLFMQLMMRMQELLPVYIICGNHDYRQDLPEEPDMLDALLSALNCPRIAYLRDTGLYAAGSSIGFGIVAVKDVLIAGSGSGHTTNRVAFPDPTHLKTAGIQHTVALYHGMIQGSCSQAQAQAQTSENSLPNLSWFAGYDVVMLGDVHMQQIHKVYKKTVSAPQHQLPRCQEVTLMGSYVWMIPDAPKTIQQPWGYPGSLVQQNFGEPLLGHGFFVWDLPERSVAMYHVNSSYGFITLNASDGVYMIEGVESCSDIPDWLPKTVHARLLESSEGELNDEIRIRALVQSQYPSLSISSLTLAPSRKSLTILPSISDTVNEVDLARANSPASWRTFIEETTDVSLLDCDNAVDWRSWFETVNNVCVPWSTAFSSNDPKLQTYRTKWEERNAKLDKKIVDYASVIDKARPTWSGWFKILRMEWQYLYCFEDGNKVDFTSLDGKLSCINAKNGRGKTSFMEILCVGLYGEGFPSRTTGTKAANFNAIICDRKPKEADASVTIDICLNGNEYYRITRSFQIDKMPKATLHMCGSVANPGPAIHQGRAAVDRWVGKHLGNVETFLLSCMVTQNRDNDFFALKPSEQRTLLDTVLSLNIPGEFAEVLKEAKLAHGYLLDMLKSVRDAGSGRTGMMQEDLSKLANTSASITSSLDRIEADVQGALHELEVLQVSIVGSKVPISILDLPESKLYEELHKAEAEVDIPHGCQVTESTDVLRERMKHLIEEVNCCDSHEHEHDSYPSDQELKALIAEAETIIASAAINDDNFMEIIAACEAWAMDAQKQLKNILSDNAFRIDFTDKNIDALSDILKVTEQSLQDTENAHLEAQKELDSISGKLDSTRTTYEAMLLSQPMSVSSSGNITEEKCRSVVEAARRQCISYEMEYDNIDNLNVMIANVKQDCPSDEQVLTLRAEKEAWLLRADELQNKQDVLINNTQTNMAGDRIACLDIIIHSARMYAALMSQIQNLMQEREAAKNTSNATKKILQVLTREDEVCRTQVPVHLINNALEMLKSCPEVLLEGGASSLTKQIQDVRLKCNDAVDTLETAEAKQAQLHALVSTRDNWAQLLQRILDCTEQETALCNHRKWSHTVSDLQQAIRHLEAELKASANKLVSCERSLVAQNNRLNHLRDIMNGYRERLSMMLHARVQKDATKTIQVCKQKLHRKRKLEELKQIESVLVNREDYERACQRLHELQTALTMKCKYEEWKQKRLELQASERLLQETRTKAALLSAQYAELQEQFVYEQNITQWVHQLSVRRDVLDILQSKMESYKSWAYEKRVIPRIRHRVNSLVSTMIGSDLSLEATIHNESIVWNLKCGTHCPPIEKASGFQQFMVSLAMRIALGQLGVMDTFCRQLFIDEGFTACDTDNLAQAPAFLRNLLSLYDGVLLVSHLEEIKDNVDFTIRINGSRLVVT